MPTRKTSRPYRPPQDGDTPNESLQEEIDFLRVVIRRVYMLAEEGHSLEDLLRILNAASIACTRLSTLIRAQQTLSQDSDAALSRALKVVLSDMRAKKPTIPPAQS